MLIRARIHEIVKGPSDKRARCPGSSWGRWPVLILLWIVSSPGVSPRGAGPTTADWTQGGGLVQGWSEEYDLPRFAAFCRGFK